VAWKWTWLVARSFFALRRRATHLGVIGILACSTGCGGNVATTPVPVPTASTFSVTQNTPYAFTPQPSQASFALPQGGGFSGGSVFGTALAPSQGTLTETIQNVVPVADGVPALSVVRGTGRQFIEAIPQAHTTLLYIGVSADHEIDLPSAPGFTITIPAADIVAGSAYFIAFYDRAARAWVFPFEGPATVNGSTLTFTAAAGAFAFTAGARYWFALVSTAPLPTPAPSASASAAPSAAPSSSPSGTPSSSPSGTPSSSPSGTPSTSPTPVPPTPTPTPGPVGVLLANPSSVSVVGTGAANAQSVNVGETGYAGTFSVSSDCAGIATISPATAQGPTANFTVTGSAAGSCTVTFTDGFNQHAATSVVVTTNGFIISSKSRGI
jgi:hypothetical protein